MFKEKDTFGVIVGTRGFFDPKLAEDGRTEIVKRLGSIGYGVLIPPKELTSVGSDSYRVTQTSEKEVQQTVSG